MRKTLYISALFLALSFHADADTQTPMHLGKDHWQTKQFMLLAMLDLSEEQREQLDAIRGRHLTTEQKPLRAVLKPMMNLDPMSPEYGRQVDDIATEAGEQLRQHIQQRARIFAEFYVVLTPEQQDRLRNFRDSMREFRQDEAAVISATR